MVFCHRYDWETPTLETVLAMGEVIRQGKALYWGTSEWPASRIMEAIHLADKYHVPRPIAEQAQYNLLSRKPMEIDYAPLFDDYGYSTTIWSPLAMGVLTGKYNEGIPPESRFGKSEFERKLVLEGWYNFGETKSE